MTARKYWFGETIDEQKNTVQNLSAKLPQYQAALALTNQEVADVQLLCAEFIATLNEVGNCAVSMKALTEWRNDVVYGEFTDKAAAAPPQFLQVPTPTVKSGIVAQLKMFRDGCLAKPGFTTEMGEDMGLLGQQISPRPPSQITPAFKVSAGENFTVTLNGNMQGFTAARVEYRTNGGTFAPIGFIQNSGGSVAVPTPTDVKPQAGEVRAVFVKQGQPYGNYSPNYSVVVS